MCGLGNKETHREVGRALRFEYIGLALWRLRLTDVRKGQRITGKRPGEHAERQPRKILFDAGHPRAARRLQLFGVGGGGPPVPAGRRASRGTCIRSPRRSHGDRSAFLRRYFVFPHACREFDGDLEFDRHEVVAADLLRASRGDERLDGGQTLVAAQLLRVAPSMAAGSGVAV
jgi:hypothetical protein